jgi:RNA polymerase sigma-70 factor (ECF subfamily)
MRATSNEITPTDEELAQLIARRDGSTSAWRAAQDACGQLYQRHARKLLAFLAARGNRDEIEDIHQLVWERVWHHLPEGFRGGNFRAWLYQIARNSLIDHGRKHRPEALPDEHVPTAREEDRPDLWLVEQERMVILSRCLERLEAEAAQAAELVRARLAGESYPELCERMGLRPERAHKLFHLAKEQLQKCVERATS